MVNAEHWRGPRQVATFLVLALALSWACWWPLVAGAAVVGDGAGQALLQAGSAGPLVAALLMIAPRNQREMRARWWRRLTNIRGLFSPGGLLCLALPVLVLQLSLETYVLAGGIDLPAPRPMEALALLAPTVLLGALPEELGWRGYALPILLRQRDPVAPTLWLSLGWALWYLPLFYIPGTYHAGIGIPSMAGLFFVIGIAAQSLLMSAFYLGTRCTWAAVLFHGTTLLIGEAWQLPVAAEMHRSLWTLLLAALLLLVPPPFGLASRRPD